MIWTHLVIVCNKIRLNMHNCNRKYTQNARFIHPFQYIICLTYSNCKKPNYLASVPQNKGTGHHWNRHRQLSICKSDTDESMADKPLNSPRPWNQQTVGGDTSPALIISKPLTGPSIIYPRFLFVKWLWKHQS